MTLARMLNPAAAAVALALAAVAVAVPGRAWGQTTPPPPPPGSPGPAPGVVAPYGGPPPAPLPLVPLPLEEVHPRRTFSLTISPLHLISPIFELTGEVRANDKLGVALVAGAGRLTDNATNSSVKISASVYEVGAQLRYYLVGDFRHGMQLGGELLYLHLSDANLSAKGVGTAVGPFLGYKYTADVGFTFDTQLGFEHVVARGSASGGGTSSGSTNVVLLNINVGWSF